MKTWIAAILIGVVNQRLYEVIQDILLDSRKDNK